uniref:Uncharacterized protein n=1 Tax=Odontella aurita TaxID=265563 RepID=A0A7S4MK22_9STRA
MDELAGFQGLPPTPGGGAESMPTMTEEDPVPVPYSAPPPAPSWGGFKLPFDMAAAPGTVVAGSIATGQMQMQHHHHTFPVAKAFAVDFRAANTSFDPVPIAASKQQGLGFDLGMNAMGHMKVMGHT